MKLIFDKIDIEKIVNDRFYIKPITFQLNYIKKLPIDVVIDLIKVIIDEIEDPNNTDCLSNLPKERQNEVLIHKKLMDSRGFLSWVTTDYEKIKPFHVFWKEVSRVLLDAQKSNLLAEWHNKGAIVATCLIYARKYDNLTNDKTEWENYAVRFGFQDNTRFNNYSTSPKEVVNIKKKNNLERMKSVFENHLQEFPNSLIQVKKLLKQF